MKPIRMKDGNGSAQFTATDERSLELIEGQEPFLWIGNASKPLFCYGIIEGRDLERLAAALNRVLAKTRTNA